MPFGALAFLVVYTVALTYITLYCLLQFDLLWHYLRPGRREAALPAASPGSGSRKPPPAAGVATAPILRSAAVGAGRSGAKDRLATTETAPCSDSDLPLVTVQLPIYNEKYVVGRLLDHIADLDYPWDRLQVQVLDDSTDETRQLVQEKAAALRERGFPLEVVHRKQRSGYKAGALRDAMPEVRGAFIAIFDADFVPRPDFLRRTLPPFADPRVAVVQTRWEHLNASYSLLTRLQALQLNVHFSVEQAGRMRAGYLLQFNGTAGVWRRAAIEDAGGWAADTLTEDLDLSVRAQLRGWRIQYLEAVGAPAELPVDMPGLKSQQYRWMKGGAETARKLLPQVWRSRLGFWKKVQASFHLLASSVFLFILLCGLSSIPLMLTLDDLAPLGIDRDFFVWFLAGLLSIVAVYFTGNVLPRHDRRLSAGRIAGFLWRFPLFLALSMGLSVHNGWAVLQGYLGKRSPFVRTPKYAIEGSAGSYRRKAYRARSLSWVTGLEGLLALLFAAAAAAGLWLDQATFFGFHLMLALGFGCIFFYTWRHTRRR